MTAVALADIAVPEDRSLPHPDRMLLLTVGGVVGAAAILVGLACSDAAHAVTPGTYHIALAVTALIAADTALVDIRTGRNAESVTFAEAMLAVALLLVPWSFLLPLAGVCVLAAHALRGRPLLKSLFNAASFVIAAALAATVLAIGHVTTLETLRPRDIAWVAAALLIFWIWNGFATATVVAMAAQRPISEVYQAGFVFRTLVGVGNIVAGLSIAVVARWALPALAVLPPLLLLLYVVYRGYLGAARDRDLWRQLEVATKEMNRLDEAAVAHAALENALLLFGADWVELTLIGTDGTPTSHRLDPSPEDRVSWGTAAAMETCTMGRLVGPNGDLGTLRIGMAQPTKVTRRDLQALATYARTVTTMLFNARLHAEVQREAERAAHDAAHDALTGLSNRNLLINRAAMAFTSAAANGTNAALLLLDLDHFKEINDTLGHAAGDLLLRNVADRLASAVPQTATIARFGGDEFAVLLPEITHPGEATALAAELLAVLGQPVTFEGMRLSIEGSMGVACYPDDGTSVAELLQRADVAMYQAKDDPRRCMRYDAERDASSLDRMALVAELRAALEGDELTPYFQPQIDLATGEVIGYEALVRWQHPTRGLLTPCEFVAVADHSGLVRQFALHVLDRAIAECAVWHRYGVDTTVAVNLSARNLLDRQLPGDVDRVLARHGLRPEALVLEITETTMMSELEVVEDVLAELRSLGVALSVDDFGTGYSSLALLQRIAVNEVKIDRTFVRNMLTSPSDHTIVRATIDLAHGLGLRVVAEGVESGELCDALAELGCDLAQGFHLGRPAAAPEIRDAVAASAATGARVAPRLPRQRRTPLTVVDALEG